jgi:FMN-dependent NADH-azoreductase
MRLLHIDASPRTDRSRSRAVAESFLAALPARVEVTRLDVWEAQLPSLGGEIIEGRYNLIMGEDVAPAVAADWARIRRFTDDTLAHDAWLISTPMWNFGIPYKLKHFIDIVTQPDMAFRNNRAGDVEGLAADKRVAVIAASAMPFGVDKDIESLDFQLRYLESWLGFIGVRAVDSVRVAPTFGLPEAVDAAMAEAHRQAAEISAKWFSG